MGSWLTAVVKKAFSPHKSSKTATQHHHHHHSQNKRSRWLFKKSSSSAVVTVLQDETNSSVSQLQKHAAAEPVAATAHAAAGLIRVTPPTSSVSVNHHFAAIIIQTSFRAYLARRALRALKGIVMLQAVIRGQNVRKQATITLRCMQALLRVQSRVHEQRSRLSHHESRKSNISENTTLWESKYLQDVKDRKSMSRDGSCIPDDWSDRPHNLEELDAILQNRRMSNRNPSTMDEKELEETVSWLDRWIEAKQWENHRTSRASFDRRDSIKTVEIDSSRPRASHYIPNSPSRRSSYSPSTGQYPITPSPIKTRPPQIRSASPRCTKEERSYMNANIQSLRSTPRVTGSMFRYSTCTSDMSVPNYMAATESAKAKIRSQSTPRQRPATPERERVGSVKKRLAYPVQDPSEHDLRSPSFKSVQVRHVGMGQQWYYDDSTTGGELSPCSTTHLRRWLR